MDNKSLIEGNWPLLNNIKPFLQEAWKKQGFKSPTEIQKLAIPDILSGKDIIGVSPTGTGKTVAYLLPILENIDSNSKNVQAIILAPSHELVMQIYQEIKKWTNTDKIKYAAFIGGANIKKQLEKLKEHPQLIVATSGRLLEIIKMKKLKMHEVKTIVIDEFDVLIAQEHLNNIKSIIKTTLKERQLLFFSATKSNSIEQLAQELSIDPKIIIATNEQKLSTKVDHIYFICDQREKIEIFRGIINSINTKALAFFNDAEKISEVEAKLKYKGVQLSVLLGEAYKSERKNSIENFRADKLSILLATDVAARGLDIEGLTHVIHFDLPRESKQYLHRSGRTGRMGAAGTVISIVTNKEERDLKEIGKQLGITITKKRLYRGEVRS